MKVFVSVDMEGISGIVHNQDVNPGHARWSESRTLMTGDCNAAIEGLLEAGATEIVVNESHASMRNLLLETLHPAATVVRGFHKSQCMVEGLDRSFDAAVFVGYHARAGKKGVLSHTISGKNFWEVRINGKPVGETAINALIAAAHGVPVIMVSGDDVLCDEVRADLGDGVVTVQTKRAIDRYSAECLHPSVAQARIRAGAMQAVADRAVANRARVNPVPVPAEIILDLTLCGDTQAWAVSCFPGVRRTEERTVRYETDDPMTLYPFLVAAYLASAGVNQSEAL